MAKFALLTFSFCVTLCFGPIAQRLEPPAHNRPVPGSNPGGPTFARVARGASDGAGKPRRRWPDCRIARSIADSQSQRFLSRAAQLRPRAPVRKRRGFFLFGAQLRLECTMNADLERLIALQQLDSTAHDAERRARRRTGAAEGARRASRGGAPARRAAKSSSPTTRTPAARSKKTSPCTRAASRSFATRRWRSRPTQNTTRCSRKSRSRRPRSRRSKTRSSSGCWRPTTLTAAVKQAETELATEQKTVDAERKALAAEHAELQGVARAGRGRARARSSRALDPQVLRDVRAGRQRRKASRSPRRATASARSATCGCGRRCSTPCGATKRSSSATAASASCTSSPHRRPAAAQSHRDRLPCSTPSPSPSRRSSPTSTAARGAIPGPAGYGVRIERPDGTLVEEFGEAIGVATNNVAEYRGLLAALEWARAHGSRSVHVRSDSLLLVQQMLGNYKVKNAGLQPLHARRGCSHTRSAA